MNLITYHDFSNWIVLKIKKNKFEIIKVYFIILCNHYIDHNYSIKVFNNECIKRIIHNIFQVYNVSSIHSQIEIIKNILTIMMIILRILENDINFRITFIIIFAIFLQFSEFTWNFWNYINSSFSQFFHNVIQFIKENFLL